MPDDTYKKLNELYNEAIGGEPFGPYVMMDEYAVHLNKLHIYWIERLKNLVRDQEDF